jgi:hypothetical protein
MGCTITEINSDEEMENARELFNQAVHQSHSEEQEEDPQSTSLIPMKRPIDIYPDVEHFSSTYHSNSFSPHTGGVPLTWDDVSADSERIPINQPMWPFNFRSEFTDFPKRIRTVYVQRPIVHVIAPRPHVLRYIPSPRVYIPQSPVVYRRIEPVYSDLYPDYADELIQSENTDDEDDLTK